MMNLFNLRKSMHVFQKDVADAIGVSRQVYSTYETGIAEPSIDTLCKLSKYFNVSIDVLVGNSELPKTTEQDNKYYTELEDLIRNLKYSDQLQVLGFIKGLIAKK